MARLPPQAKLYIEPIVAVIIGIIFYFPLKNELLAEIVWIIGALLTLNNFTLTYYIKTEIHSLKESFSKINTLCSEYFKVDDADFADIKEETIDQCINSLNALSKGEITICGNAYYRWLSTQVDKCKKDLYAVSSMDEKMWVKDHRERHFYQRNVKAAKRGVNVTRIFVTTKGRTRNGEHREIILKHIEDDLTAYVILLEEIKDPSLKPIAGKGFLILDDRIVFTDLEPPEETIGKAMKCSAEIKRYKNIFDQLMLQVKNARDFLLKRYTEIEIEMQDKYGDIQDLKRLIQDPNIKHDADKLIKLKEDYNIWGDVKVERDRLQ